MAEPVAAPAVTAQWLLERVVEREGCLVWKLQCCNAGRDPRAVMDRKKFNVRRAVWAAFHGRQPPVGMPVVAICKTPACCDPAHLALKTRSQLQMGKTKSLATRAKIAAAKRLLSKLPDEAVAQVLASELTGEDEAMRWGMCKSSINKIRQGAMRRDFTSPFAALAA